MLKLGITETAYTEKYGYVNGLERMRADGFDSMDYQEFVHTDTPLFEKNAKEFEAYLSEQRSIAEQTGIGIHQVHGPWRWPSQDATEEDRRERFDKMARSIEGTAILGSKHFVIHPIMPFQANDKGYEKISYDMNLQFMGKLTELAEQYGIIICFENMPMPELSLGSVEAVLEFVKTMNRKNFQICLDTGHCTMFQTAPADAVRLIGKEHLYALHIHDNDGKVDLHWDPFTGVIDWTAFGKALHEIHYEGVISLEPSFPVLPDQLHEQKLQELYQKAKRIAAK